MIQSGKVIDLLEDQRAKVLMKKHAACGDCGACEYGREKMDLKIVARNPVEAKIGDIVQVDLETHNVLKAAFIAYVIPLIALLMGVFSTNYFLKSIGMKENVEMYAILVGLILTMMTYGIIKRHEKNFKKNGGYVPAISKIIEEKQS